MAMKSEDPGKDVGSVGKWDHGRTKRGQTWYAWKAGDPFGCYVHPMPGQPCVSLYTRGALECRRCGPKSKIEWQAYVPLYRESDDKSVFVVIKKNAHERAKQIPFRACVRVTRADEDNAGVVLTHEPRKEPLKTARRERQAKQDISVFLLATLWKLPDFASWCEKNDTYSPTEEDVLEVMKDTRRKELEDLPKMDLRRMLADELLKRNGHTGLDGPQLLGDLIPPPETNGKPKPK